MADGSALTVERIAGRRNVILRFSIPEAVSNLQMSYSIDPTYFPPGSQRDEPSNARSRITPGLAVLRTTCVFPVGELVSGEATVDSRLPAGWTIAWPWPQEGLMARIPSGELAQAEYFVAGNITFAHLRFGENTITLTQTPETDRVDMDKVAMILSTYEQTLGPSAFLRGRNTLLSIVPHEFMRGGAAGTVSAVQPPHLITVAHEILHWWNPGGVAQDDARWFSEGFTEYLSIRALADARLISIDDRNHALADLQSEAEFLQAELHYTLAEASIASLEDPRASRLVYAEGAMLGYAIDELLRIDGKSLAAFVGWVNANFAAPLSSLDVRAAARDRLGSRLESFFDSYVTGRAALPHIDFGPATGSSGVARYLPPGTTKN